MMGWTRYKRYWRTTEGNLVSIDRAAIQAAANHIGSLEKIFAL